MNRTRSIPESSSQYPSNMDWGESFTWFFRNLSVNYRVIGDKKNKPVVMIHGFGASCDHWRHNAQMISQEGYRVYGIDLIGFGKSEQSVFRKINGLNNYFWCLQLSDFLEEVVNVKKYGKAILIGNSLGGLTALTTAAFNPHLVKALVAAPLPDPAFMATWTFPKNKWLKTTKKLLIHLFFKLIPFKALINLICKTNLIKISLQAAYQKSISQDKDLLRIVTEPAKRPYAASALKAMCLGMSLRELEITAPNLLNCLKKNPIRPHVLLIWGREDKLVPLVLAKKIIKMHPWLKLLVLEQAGHCPHDELPNYFNQYVLKWLETID